MHNYTCTYKVLYWNKMKSINNEFHVSTQKALN